MSHTTGNYYSAEIGTTQINLSGPNGSRYEMIVTDTFGNACAIARTLCRTGEQVKGVSLIQENVVVDIDAITAGD